MTDEDLIFEDIRALCDDAEDMGLRDVALVLEFALDVFLKETAEQAGPPVVDAIEALAQSAKRLEKRKDRVPAVGWSMSSFPLASMDRKVS